MFLLLQRREVVSEAVFDDVPSSFESMNDDARANGCSKCSSSIIATEDDMGSK